jgi:hypothetical protein
VKPVPEVRSWHIASFRCYATTRRLSKQSGLWCGVSPADLWVHGLIHHALAEMEVRVRKVRRRGGGADIDVDDVGIGKRAACAGRAAVVAGDGQVIGAA